MGGQTWWLVRLACVFNGWLDLVVLMGWLEMFVINQFGGGYFLEVEGVFRGGLGVDVPSVFYWPVVFRPCWLIRVID